jgi:cytochrome c-type biogenesis protein CcmH/NrfG
VTREEALMLLGAASPRVADSVFAAGAKAVKHGYEDDALPLLEAGAAAHPGDARIWQVLGLARRKREEMIPALAALEKAAALAPADALIAHTLARATLEAGRPATHLFDRAHALAPMDGSVLLGRAGGQLAEGRIDDAIAGLEAQVAAHPGWLDGHAALARLLWLKGERVHFTDSFAAAVKIAPGELPLWREWANTLMHADLYADALAVAAQARAVIGDHIALDAIETVATAELGETEAADALFARLGPIEHVTMAARYMRHLLRAGRAEAASGFVAPWLEREGAELVWPYAAAAWRLTGDPRWEWLEGDERLVGVYDIGDTIPSLDALAERLRGLHLALGQPLEQSVRGGTQTDGPLFSRIEPEIRALRAAIVAAVERHVAQFPRESPGHPTFLPRRGPTRFAGSWSVRLTDAGFHSNHIHPAGWLSSAFYVGLPEGVGDASSREGWLCLGQPQADLGLDLAPFRTIEPRVGRLVLFPSTMWHGTIPFTAGERLTVAFDVAYPQ